MHYIFGTLSKQDLKVTENYGEKNINGCVSIISNDSPFKYDLDIHVYKFKN